MERSAWLGEGRRMKAERVLAGNQIEPGHGILHSCLVLTSLPCFLQGVCWGGRGREAGVRTCLCPRGVKTEVAWGTKRPQGRFGSIEPILGTFEINMPLKIF